MKRLSNVATDASWRVRGARLVLAATVALLFGAVGIVLWDPNSVLWARNGYGMAQAGAWTGMAAMAAQVAYWFYELKGRVVVSFGMLVVLGWMLWRAYAAK